MATTEVICVGKHGKQERHILTVRKPGVDETPEAYQTYLRSEAQRVYGGSAEIPSRFTTHITHPPNANAITLESISRGLTINSSTTVSDLLAHLAQPRHVRRAGGKGKNLLK